MPASIVTEGADDAAAAMAGRRAVRRKFMMIATNQEWKLGRTNTMDGQVKMTGGSDPFYINLEFFRRNYYV